MYVVIMHFKRIFYKIQTSIYPSSSIHVVCHSNIDHWSWDKNAIIKPCGEKLNVMKSLAGGFLSSVAFHYHKKKQSVWYYKLLKGWFQWFQSVLRIDKINIFLGEQNFCQLRLLLQLEFGVLHMHITNFDIFTLENKRTVLTPWLSRVFYVYRHHNFKFVLVAENTWSKWCIFH